MKPAILLLTISALAVFSACSKSTPEKTAISEGTSSSLTLQVTGMT